MQNNVDYNNSIYVEDLENSLKSIVGAQALRGKSLLITGATGMIGSFVVDVLLHGNKTMNLGCKVICMGRNLEKAKSRFAQHWNCSDFSFVQHNVNEPLPTYISGVDYVIHAASSTHPLAYATQPVETITTNILGAYYLLNYICKNAPRARFVLMSSVEVYGQNRGDVMSFNEDYCGYIDCNSLRSGYPESKRLSESLCQAFLRENMVDFVSARLPRTYGPTMLMSDTKALSQFIKKGIAKEDIILKSKGEQLFSYAYVADVVSAVLTIMLVGKSGSAYNISSSESDIKLRDLAQMVADLSGTSLRYELPDSVEMAGYSTANVAVMDSSRLRELGWKHHYLIREGLGRTLSLLGGEEMKR